MKAISLWQPWASLILSGRKRYETRSWQVAHRGWLLIHAAKKRTPEITTMAAREPFASSLPATFTDLPFGALLGAVKIVACHAVDAVKDTLSAEERSFGDYTQGRWAWELTTPILLPKPIPWRGEQGLFTVHDEHLPTTFRDLLT